MNMLPEGTIIVVSKLAVGGRTRTKISGRRGEYGGT